MDDIKVGDVIICKRSDGKLIIHPVIAVENHNFYRTRGWNNVHSDGVLIPKFTIMGVVLFTVWCKDGNRYSDFVTDIGD